MPVASFIGHSYFWLTIFEDSCNPLLSFDNSMKWLRTQENTSLTYTSLLWLFLVAQMVKKVKVAPSCPTLCAHRVTNSMVMYSPWNSPGQNTRVGSLSFLRGIFPTQEWNPGLPHCGVDSVPIELSGKSWLQESVCNAGDSGLIPGSGRSLGEGSGNPFQYSGLVNPLEKGAWQATGPGVTKSWAQLSD